MNKATIATSLGLGVSLAVSCAPTQSVLDPTHCAGNDGDAFCAREHPEGDRAHCWLSTAECDEASGITDVDHDGCLAERPEDACYSACGGGASVLDDPECEGVADTTLSSTTGTETMSSDTPPTSSGMTADPTTEGMTESGTESDTTDGPGCTGDDDCMDVETPFCDPAGTCVACDGMPDGDAACAGADPGVPVCDAGVCVQCTEANAVACEGQTPICGDDNACRGCVEHSECSDSACHLDGADVGGCFDEADVEMIANTAALTSALSGLGAGDQAVFILASGTYAATLDIGGGAEVAVLGQGNPVLAGDGSRAVDVFSSGIVYLAAVEVVNGSGDGVACSGTSVWLDDSEVRNNAQVGLDVSGGCAAHLRRSIIRVNNGGGLVVNGAALHVQNSAVSSNFGSSPGVQILNSTLEMTYSTLVGNFASGGTPDTLQCTNPTGFVRNSIVLGETAPSISGCAALSWDFNAVDTSSLGATNDDLGAWNPDWFNNPDDGNYHLTPTGETAFDGIAEWQDGDPLSDVDGHPIPTAMPSFPGYDQP
jgi:hypothetical protein